MTPEVFLSPDDTIPPEGLQVGVYLGDNQARIVFDTDYTGLTDAFLAQAVTLSIVRDNQDAIILHHPDNSFIAELHAWWDRDED